MNQRLKYFISILFLQLLCINFTCAQNLIKRNAIELHPWQRWDGNGHDSNCLGLTYVRNLNSILDICGETGLRFINEKLGHANNAIGYLSVGSRFYFKKSRTFNADVHLLYDNKTLYESDQKLGLKIGAGFTNQITDAIHFNINGGLLMDRYNGNFYIGLSLGHRF